MTDWLAEWLSNRLTDWLARWLADGLRWGMEVYSLFPGKKKESERLCKEGDKKMIEEPGKDTTQEVMNRKKTKQGEGGRDSEEWEIDEERESSQSKDKKRHWRRRGSEVVRQRWRDSKRCLIKKRSFSCHHQESLCQPTASVSEKKRTETSSPDSLASNSIGTGDFRNKGRKKTLKSCYHT